MATATLQYLPDEMRVRKDLDIRAGDTVKVHVKIEEKGKTRIQIFEGLVLATKHGHEPGASITVRKIASGVGVERVFPLYSPIIDKIEILRRSKVRRAKLYYIRTKVAREIRRKMRNFLEYFSTTADLVPPDEMMDEISEEVNVSEKKENVEEAKKETLETGVEIAQSKEVKDGKEEADITDVEASETVMTEVDDEVKSEEASSEEKSK